jgi:hypothetical protein
VTVSGGTAKREEMFTTGLGAYANTRLSENAIRREVGLPVRTDYTFPDDHTHIVSLAPALDGSIPKGYWLCDCVREHFGEI